MNKIKGLLWCRIVFLLLAPIFILGAGVMYTFLDYIHDHIIYTNISPNPGSLAYHYWQITDPKPVMDVYMFNWTNAEDVYKRDIIPNFEQVGPYRFQRTREKFDIVFHEENNTVTYKIRERFDFVEEGSKPLTDVIKTINSVALVAGYQARHSNPVQRTILSVALASISSIYVTRPVGELLFAGYKDRLLDMARPFSTIMQEDVVDRFGFLRPRNESQIGGAYNVYLGTDYKFGDLLMYDYKETSDFYRDECGKFRGSSGEYYPLNRRRDFIELFISDMCTNARLDYEKDVTQNGLDGYRYTSKYMFDTGVELPERTCFCSTDGCLPTGVFNVSLCNKNTPTFLSLPHFYNADPHYRTAITGMKPEKDKHEFYLVLEPKTSVAYSYGIRAQLNVLLEPIKGIGLFYGVPKVMLPILYLDEVQTVSDNLLDSLYLLQNLPTYIKITSGVLFTLGVLPLLCVLVGFCKDVRRRK